MVGGPEAPAVMHGDEEEEMLRRAQQLSLEAAEEEEARREEENARFEALEAEIFLEAQQASLNEEDAELIQALLRHLNTLHALPCHSTLPRYTPCLLYTSPSPRDGILSRMPSSA